MKRLTLVRHAKAAWKDPQTGDFHRALTSWGRAQAAALGRHLLECQLVPDLLMTSPARRAKQTSECLAHEFALPANAVKQEERCYLATPTDLLQIVHSIGSKVRHLMIVGHNPGISELAGLLSPSAGLNELATAAACSMTFNATAWRDVVPGTAEQTRFESRAPRLFGLL